MLDFGDSNRIETPGNSYQASGEQAHRETEGHVRVPRQRQGAVSCSPFAEGSSDCLQGQSLREGMSLTDDLCFAKCDLTTAFEVALSLPASYGQKQMQT